MNKAAHEAKVNSSWVNPNAEYVAAMEAFVRRILTPSFRNRKNAFLQELEVFLPPVAFFGAMNSLAQTLVTITAPGVPDTYQGSELWDLSLVDPDNRRPVDFELRQQTLEQLMPALGENPEGIDVTRCLSLISELLAGWPDGRVKMWVTLCALRFRRQRSQLFQSGSYQPITATGEQQGHVLAFLREHAGQAALTIVPRFAYSLMKGALVPPLGSVWGETELTLPLSQGEFMNLLTGERLNAANGRALLCREVFANFPVALLAPV
jgi:(1->4)-alpha-D-glucan 1-alpha-D-glucosylmutase